jgi:cytosine/adenosine deaminase-related metal-dependent hydrolase
VPTFSAAWILPVSGPPIRNGFVTLERDRITGVGAGTPANAESCGGVAILPALVNAHTHLELSYLHERVPTSSSFNEWVMSLMALRRNYPDPRAPLIIEAARRAITDAHAAGTGLFGDISNTLVTVPLLREAGISAQVFYELIGFSHPDPGARVRDARAAAETAGIDEGGVRISLSPHAPYSVSPGLFSAIRVDVDAHAHPVTTVHLGESAAEVELLLRGSGPARVMLERLGVWTNDWHAPGVSPVRYLDRLGFLKPHSLVVHGVQFTADDLACVKAAGSPLVSCPRSNLHVGVGSPPLESFYAAGVPVAFGTDSLASVPDLNMFTELAEAHRVAPAVSARDLLRSATLIGATALGRDDEFGSIDVGKRASLITVRVPPHVADVEEYLVSGIEPDAISWLNSQRAIPNAQ